MVMYNRLCFMIYKKLLLILAVVSLLCITGCGSEEPVDESCQVRGYIDGNGGDIAGTKVTMQNVKDISLKYVAVADGAGMFEIKNMASGTYVVSASKGDSQLSSVEDGSGTVRNNQVTLRSGETTTLFIYMTKPGITTNFDLTLTDMNGNPVNDDVNIYRSTTTVGFRLTNNTNNRCLWDISNVGHCFVTDLYGMKYEPVFSSFGPTEGTLQSGDAVLIMGIVNPEMFNMTDGYINDLYATITFSLGISHKEIRFKINP